MVIKCWKERVQGAVEKYMGEKGTWPSLGVKEGFPRGRNSKLSSEGWPAVN